jgi:uncharacterized protein
MSNEPAEALRWIRQLHDAVDTLTAPVEHHHRERLACRAGCTDCCVDGLTVFELEADRIRAEYSQLLAEGTPHPVGQCALLDERGRCRVYAARPYVCRTQGLPLRWLDESDDGIERRDVCEKNLKDVDLTVLPAETLWTLGPVEQRLAQRQAMMGGGSSRIALRSLFSRSKVHLPVSK